MRNISKKCVMAVAVSSALGLLSACGTNDQATLSAKVNDSVIEGASVTVQVINDQGQSVTVSPTPGTSRSDGTVDVNFDISKMKSMDMDWPVVVVADKTLASGEKLHFETHLGSVSAVLGAAADGAVNMETEGDSPEISNTGMAKMTLMRELMKKQLVDSGSTLDLDALPASAVYDPALWDKIGAEMSEAVMLSSIAVKTVVDYGAKIDVAHVTDYNGDGSIGTDELSRKIAEDIVAGKGKTLDYYVLPDATQVLSTVSDIMADIKVKISENPDDPIASYGESFAGKGDFVNSDGFSKQLSHVESFAEAKQQVSTIDATGIPVAVGNVYTLVLSRDDGSAYTVSYTAQASDTDALVAKGLKEAIESASALAVSVSLSNETITVTGNEEGVGFTISVTAANSSGTALAPESAPSFTSGAPVEMDWTLPAEIQTTLVTNLEAIESAATVDMTKTTEETSAPSAR